MHIKMSYENVEMLKIQHEKMKSWHENAAKQNTAAALWHKNKIEEFERSMMDNFMEEEKMEDDEMVESTYMSEDKKYDLMSILKDHVQEYGEFSRSIEEIVEIIEGN